jgi:hypothetical protein
MHATVSISGAAAYGKNGLAPDTPAGAPSLVEVAQQVVHGFPGGVAAVAALLGVSPNTLAHKLNPNNARHHLHPDELARIGLVTGNHAILYALAGLLGEECSRAMPDQSGGDVVEAFWRWQCAAADLARAVADPLYRKGIPTSHECRRVGVMASDLKAATTHLDAVLRAMVPAAPGAAGAGALELPSALAAQLAGAAACKGAGR